MTRYNIRLITGLLALIILIILTTRLLRLPTLMLSSVYVTAILIVGIVIGSIIVAGVVKVFFKKPFFFTIYFCTVSIACSFFIWYFYSPSLTIIVPNNFTGQVNLVLSNTDSNILTLDKNGIGYINKQTFAKTYAKPIVLDTEGKNINTQCIGFNPSVFWGKTNFSSSQSNIEIHSLSFEVVPTDKIGHKQYYSTDLINLVDKKKLYP